MLQVPVNSTQKAWPCVGLIRKVIHQIIHGIFMPSNMGGTADWKYADALYKLSSTSVHVTQFLLQRSHTTRVNQNQDRNTSSRNKHPAMKKVDSHWSYLLLPQSLKCIIVQPHQLQWQDAKERLFYILFGMPSKLDAVLLITISISTMWWNPSSKSCPGMPRETFCILVNIHIHWHLLHVWSYPKCV